MEIKNPSFEEMLEFGRQARKDSRFVYIPPAYSEPLYQEVNVGYKFSNKIRYFRFGKFVILKGWPGSAFIRAYKRRK